MLDFLRRHPKDEGVLVAAATDTSALGALQAVREAKRERDVAIVGQDCIPEALDEMSIPGSCFIGSVSHEASTYGPHLVQLGLAILNGQTLPPIQLRQTQAGNLSIPRTARFVSPDSRAQPEFHY